MRPSPQVLVSRLVLPLFICAVAQTAAAQADLQRVEVAGHRPAEALRVDVRQACPNIESALDAALTPAIQMIGETGSLHVQFRVDGQRVGEVRSSGGPRKYAGPIGRAVRALQCSDGGSAQHFAFTLRIADPADDRSGSERLALVIEP